MTMGIAREFARQGIRCLSISPGVVDTSFHDQTPLEVLKGYTDLTPMGRMATPEEIAETILFACSDAPHICFWWSTLRGQRTIVANFTILLSLTFSNIH